MKLAACYSHRYGEEEWARRDLLDWIKSICEESSIDGSMSKVVTKHFRDQLTAKGWSDPVRISVDSNVTIFSLYSDLAFQVQTGNVSRYAYDLLKLQYLYQAGKINAVGFALPSKEAAKKMNDNVANAERAWKELCIFDRIITVPILILAFE
ncbi:BglII/BstYI family type II restriction endonuclease [Psychrobacillus sp. FSL H8-0483]|uniref:BglII/BstYI family type II restriction endonuclease n=1 Tax=Psychrobacillus sp. FSL H8-0483 TaxID=2921389 RepID=UPI00315A9040